MRFTLHRKRASFVWVIYLIFLWTALYTGCRSTNKRKNTAKIPSPSTLETLAQEYYEQKRYRRCIETYRNLIDLYSHRFDRYEKQLAWAHYEIGFCYLIKNRYEKALKYFRVVLKDYSILSVRILAAQRIEEIQRLKNKKSRKYRKNKTKKNAP